MKVKFENKFLGFDFNTTSINIGRNSSAEVLVPLATKKINKTKLKNIKIKKIIKKKKNKKFFT